MGVCNLRCGGEETRVYLLGFGISAKLAASGEQKGDTKIYLHKL